MKELFRNALLPVLGVVLLGCPEGNPTPSLPPPQQGPNSTVGGTWTLSGLGQRERCNDELFEGRFEMGAPPLEIRQSTNSSGADTLVLKDPSALLPMVFSGSVVDDRVTFNTVEPIGEGQQQIFRFAGVAEGLVVTGDISGSGPEGCDVSGTFAVTIIPLPAPDGGPMGGDSMDGGDPDPGDPWMGDPTFGDPTSGDPSGGDLAMVDGDQDEGKRPTIVTKALESCQSAGQPVLWVLLLGLAWRRRPPGTTRTV